MKLGLWGMVIVIGVVLSIFYVFYVEFEGWFVMFGFVKVNWIFIFSFMVLVFMVYLKRKKFIEYKCFFYIGIIYVLGFIIGRVVDKFGFGSDLSFVVFEFVIWIGLFILLLVYDIVILKKVYRIIWIGIVWFYIVWIFLVVN